ncbi:hypothetical protein [Kitasatospora sp. NPDC090091]|uniref:hypothetical protein n=1 Tax=Kitasatospora sp. NPDC090091 TaxID=3364081 RepID=UPI00382AFCFC
MMFRRAVVESRQAGHFAAQAEVDRAVGRSGLERRARERDAVISTVVLVQAAVEAFINWTHIQAGNTISSPKFDDRAGAVTQSAAILNPEAEPFTWNEDEKAFFTELTKWRNFLGHSDTMARDRLRKVLVKRGEITENASDSQMMDLLTAGLAERFVDTAQRLMNRTAEVTHLGAPFSDGAWYAPDELGEPVLEDPEQLRAVLAVVLRRANELEVPAEELAAELDRQRAGQGGLRVQAGSAGWTLGLD